MYTIRITPGTNLTRPRTPLRIICGCGVPREAEATTCYGPQNTRCPVTN